MVVEVPRGATTAGQVGSLSAASQHTCPWPLQALPLGSSGAIVAIYGVAFTIWGLTIRRALARARQVHALFSRGAREVAAWDPAAAAC